MTATRRDGDRFEDRSDVQLKLQLQTFTANYMQHAANFAKAVLLHRNNVISRKHFIECEATALIRDVRVVLRVRQRRKAQRMRHRQSRRFDPLLFPRSVRKEMNLRALCCDK